MTSLLSIKSSKERTNIIAFFTMLLIMLTLTYSTIFDMVRAWSLSHTYNHCFLIIPISIYLIYSEKSRLNGIEFLFSRAGALLFTLTSFAWVLFNLADIKLLEQLAFIAQLQSLIFACVGWQVVKRIWFPLFFMYFSVPMGEELIPWLRDITATFSVAMLKLSDIPVFLDNRYISVPNGDFFVAEACSGINYLIATATLGVIYAHYQYRSWYRKGVFLVLAVVVPIVANGIRAYGIIMIAYWTDNEYAVGVDHLIYGWIWFGVVLFLLFGVGNLIMEKDVDHELNTNENFAVPATSLTMEENQAFSQNITHENVLKDSWPTIIIMCVGAIFLTLPVTLNMISDKTSGNSISSKLTHANWIRKQLNTKQVQYPTATNITSFVHANHYINYQITLVEFNREKETDVLSSINLPFNKDTLIEIESREYNDDLWYRIQNEFGNQYWVVARSYLRGEQVVSPLNLFFTDIKQRFYGNSRPSYVIAVSCSDCEFSEAEQEVKNLFSDLKEALLK